MNILIGIIGDKSGFSKYDIDSLVYMDLASNSIDTINIRDFFSSNLEIVNIDKEHIASTLDLSSDDKFVYSNNGYSRLICLGDKFIEFNFTVPVFASSNLDKILNYPKNERFVCVYIILVEFPEIVLVIDLKTFKLSIEILSYEIYGDKASVNEGKSFSYAVHSRDGEELWEEICKALEIEIKNGVLSVNNTCFIDTDRCNTVISDKDDKKLIVYGDSRNKADIIINPNIEKLDLRRLTARNNVKLYISYNISLETLVDALYMWGYKTDKSIGLQCLISDLERRTGVKVELY
jgi:hypothetical protein